MKNRYRNCVLILLLLVLFVLCGCGGNSPAAQLDQDSSAPEKTVPTVPISENSSTHSTVEESTAPPERIMPENEPITPAEGTSQADETIPSPAHTGGDSQPAVPESDTVRPTEPDQPAPVQPSVETAPGGAAAHTPDGGSLPDPIPENPAAGQPEPPSQEPESAQTGVESESEPEPGPGPEERKTLALQCLNQPVSVLYATVGYPQYSDYAPSCLVDGEDGNLYYDGFTVYTYRAVSGEETVTYVE